MQEKIPVVSCIRLRVASEAWDGTVHPASRRRLDMHLPTVRSPFSLVGVLALALGATACMDDDPATTPASSTGTSGGTPGASSGGPTDPPGSTPAGAKDIVDTAVAAGNFKTLVSAVQGAGLESTLRGTGPFTVLAPTDDAFAKIPSFLLGQLTTVAYKTELGLILKYHVVSGSVKAGELLGKTQSVATVAGGKLAIDGGGGKVLINGNTIVTTPDVGASNGVIHAVDSVLLPSIVDTAAGYDDGTTKFSTLVTALSEAGLVSTLSGPGHFTVFAPTDAAFANLKAHLGDAAFAAILADKPKLTKILTYHVLPTTVYAKDITNGPVATVEGNHLTLAPAGGMVMIGDSTTTHAKVGLADLPNRNGVIHVIDKVLLPPGL
jgi:transforming growth factor-beta-induced protein